MEKANPDWQGAILVGYFTGARLKDVCNLRWGNIDLEKRLITFRAGKTGQRITVAIHPELEEHLLSRITSDDPQAFLFRSLAGKSGGGKSGLSMAFKRIMEQAEVDAGVARLSSGAKGRSFSLRGGAVAKSSNRGARSQRHKPAYIQCTNEFSRDYREVAEADARRTPDDLSTD